MEEQVWNLSRLPKLPCRFQVARVSSPIHIIKPQIINLFFRFFERRSRLTKRLFSIMVVVGF
jgi:hypothetical protein